MTTINWGLLGPEKLESERRTRTLGLGVAVRAFNDLAVPHLGGVKFSKSVFLACLGVHVAEKVSEQGKKVKKIEVTNAIEALACSLSFRQNGWASDQRLRGNTKLQGKDDLSYKAVSANNFYVTQPMRMATVQMLPGLGLVQSQGERFNSYSLSEHGINFVNAGCGDLKCHRIGIVNFLVKWVLGDKRHPEKYGMIQAISQRVDLPNDAKAVLKDRLVSGNDEEATRRRNALIWMNSIDKNPCNDWLKPPELTAEHFNDIKSGAYFFMLRDHVMDLLDAIETEVANSKSNGLNLKEGVPQSLNKALLKVKTAARNFLDLNHDPSPDKLVSYFAKECNQSKDEMIISSVVNRDNIVLKTRGDTIVKGPAFGGEQQEPNEDKAVAGLFPEGVSYRLWNLYVLNLDFNNQLDSWLKDKGESDE